jgi:hypothetical protein
MKEISREAATAPATLAGDLGRPPLLAGGPLGVLDVLCGDGLEDAGMHCSFLSIESCFSTAIRMN